MLEYLLASLTLLGPARPLPEIKITRAKIAEPGTVISYTYSEGILIKNTRLNDAVGSVGRKITDRAAYEAFENYSGFPLEYVDGVFEVAEECFFVIRYSEEPGDDPRDVFYDMRTKEIFHGGSIKTVLSRGVCR